MKAVIVKARDNFKAGDIIEVTPEEFGVLAEGSYAITEGEQAAVKATAAANASIEAVKASQKTAAQGVVKAAVQRAKDRHAIPKQDEAVLAKSLDRLDKGADPEIIVELLDGLRSGDPVTHTRITTSSDSGAVRARVVRTDVRDAAKGYITASEPMTKLIRSGDVKGAFQLAQERSLILKTDLAPVMSGEADFRLNDIVQAADVSDPDSQVGTLATGLVLMRNLGYLVNKLAWIRYLTTDMRNEPVLFGQPVFTRYITPPGVLTFIPGVGFTSDATTINNAGAGTVQSGIATQTSGTVTKSVPSTTDVTVTCNQFKGTQIEFGMNRLAATARSLFAEQLGAQTYALAEHINQHVLAKIFAATWTGTKTSLTKALGDWNLKALIQLKSYLGISKVPDVGRFALMHTFYHDKLMEDSNLLSAKAILSLIKQDAGRFESAELPTLFGVKALESQLAAATDGTLGSFTDDAAPGTINQVGFAGNMSSMVFVSRIPQDFIQSGQQLGVPQTAAVEIFTEPDSGLSVMLYKYYDLGKMSVNCTVCLMYGAAQGDPRVGIVLKNQ